MRKCQQNGCADAILFDALQAEIARSNACTLGMVADPMQGQDDSGCTPRVPTKLSR